MAEEARDNVACGNKPSKKKGPFGPIPFAYLLVVIAFSFTRGSHLMLPGTYAASRNNSLLFDRPRHWPYAVRSNCSRVRFG